MICSFWLFIPGETTRRWGTRLRGLWRRADASRGGRELSQPAA
jgi:hypothetical protein